MIRAAIAHETSRYVLIGGAVAVINNIVLIGGDRLGIAYPWLVLLSWAIGGTIAFALHSHVTFRVVPSRASYIQFMAGVAVGVPLSLLLFAIGISWLKMPMWLAAPLATIAMLIFNYFNARVAILWQWGQRGRPAPKEDELTSCE